MMIQAMVWGDPWRWSQAHGEMNAIDLNEFAKELDAAIHHPATQAMLAWQAAAAQRLELVRNEQHRRFRGIWNHQDNADVSELLEKISAVGL